MMLHTKNNYFKSASLQGFSQEIGLQSACSCLLLSSLGCFTHSSQPLLSEGDGFVQQQVVLHLHVLNLLMRFSFDFHYPKGRGGGGEGGELGENKQKEKNNDGVVSF